MRVWVQLAEIFGQAFYRENGDSPSRLWEQAVWKLTDKEITRGLTNLASDGLAFPANLSMFVEACQRKEVEAISPPYWGAPKLEDQRKPGRMPYSEWLQRNGKQHPLNR